MNRSSIIGKSIGESSLRFDETPAARFASRPVALHQWRSLKPQDGPSRRSAGVQRPPVLPAPVMMPDPGRHDRSGPSFAHRGGISTWLTSRSQPARSSPTSTLTSACSSPRSKLAASPPRLACGMTRQFDGTASAWWSSDRRGTTRIDATRSWSGAPAFRRCSTPSPVITWNTDKTYLRELDAAGVPTVPTTWIEPASRWEHVRPSRAATWS